MRSSDDGVLRNSVLGRGSPHLRCGAPALGRGCPVASDRRSPASPVDARPEARPRNPAPRAKPMHSVSMGRLTVTKSHKRHDALNGPRLLKSLHPVFRSVRPLHAWRSTHAYCIDDWGRALALTGRRFVGGEQIGDDWRGRFAVTGSNRGLWLLAVVWRLRSGRRA